MMGKMNGLAIRLFIILTLTTLPATPFAVACIIGIKRKSLKKWFSNYELCQGWWALTKVFTEREGGERS